MFKLMMVLACVSCPLVVLADGPPRLPPPDTATEAWLRMQSSNRQASPKVQAQTAAEREPSMQRWLDSYKYPIPDTFRYQKMSTSGE